MEPPARSLAVCYERGAVFEPSILDKLLLVGFAYLVGSLPFGVLITGYLGIDIEAVGSGNVGATNVARALGGRWALVTAALDILKGVAPVLGVKLLFPNEPIWMTLTGVAAVVGHCASVFLDFRGGKGVATSAGVMLVVAPVPTLGAALAWGLVMATSRISSLAALVALPVLLILLVLVHSTELIHSVPLLLLLGAVILWRHRGNVRRLRRGEELDFKRHD